MNTVLTVKVDDEVKKAAREVAESAGLTLSALVNSYLRQVTATRRIEIYAPEKASPKMEKIIARIEKDIIAGDTVGPFKTADEFLANLHKKPR